MIHDEFGGKYPPSPEKFGDKTRLYRKNLDAFTRLRRRLQRVKARKGSAFSLFRKNSVKNR